MVDYGGFNHSSVLVHLFESRVFQVVGTLDGGADCQHRIVVLPRIFYLAEPAYNVRKCHYA